MTNNSWSAPQQSISKLKLSKMPKNKTASWVISSVETKLRVSDEPRNNLSGYYQKHFTFTVKCAAANLAHRLMESIYFLKKRHYCRRFYSQ